MEELNSYRDLLEILNRCVFRTMKFINVNNENTITYISHPYEKSIIKLAERKYDTESDIKNELQEIESQIKTVIPEKKERKGYNAYDKYGDDEDERIEEKAEQELINNARIQVENERNLIKLKRSIGCHFLLMSFDEKNWEPINFKVVFENTDKNIFVCDLYKKYYIQLDLCSLVILANQIDKLDSEYRYIFDSDFIDKYYIESESKSLLKAIKLVLNDEGEEISREKIELSPEDFYGEKFISKFKKPFIYHNVDVENHKKRLMDEDELAVNVFNHRFDFTNKIEEVVTLAKLANASKSDLSLDDFNKIITLEKQEANDYIVEKSNYDIDPPYKRKLMRLAMKIATFETDSEHFFDNIYKLFDDISYIGYTDVLTDNYMNFCKLEENYKAKVALDAIKIVLPDWNEGSAPDSSYYYDYIDRLQLFRYLQNIISDIPKLKDEVEEFHKFYDNFENAFTVYSTDKNAILKAYAASLVANAIETNIEVGIQWNKIKHKYILDAIEEMGRTLNSKVFLCKLCEMDFKSLFYILLNLTKEKVDYLDNKYAIGTSLKDYSEYVENFFKSSSYYAIYVARKLNIKYVPAYPDYDNNECKHLNNIELLENAIVYFPFEEEYYREYLNLIKSSNRIPSRELIKLMEICNIDQSIINGFLFIIEAEEKRVEVEEKARLRREAWEAEQKRKKEEEEAARRAEQERIREESNKQYLQELSKIYGDFVFENKDLLYSLKNNIVFKTFFRKPYNNYDELLADTNKYLQTTSLVSAKFLVKGSSKFDTIYHKAKQAYINEDINSEDALFVFDATLFGNAKNGFVITKNKVFAKEMIFDAKSIFIKDIMRMSISSTSTILCKDINDISSFVELPATFGEIGNLVTAIILNIKYLDSKINK